MAAAVSSLAGKKVSMTTSDSVISTAVPNTVVALKNSNGPSRLSILSGMATGLSVTVPPPEEAARAGTG